MPITIAANDAVREDRHTVLFVDADPDTLDVYTAIASAEGMCVEIASTGREAVALTALVRPDVIVFEVVDRAGLNALHEIQENPITRDIPVVAVTNPLHERFDDDASRCAAHLCKPFNVDDLLRLLTVLRIGASSQNQGK